MRWVWLMAAAACSDVDWEQATAERAELECAFQEVCAASRLGLDCAAYVAQYEPRPNPCVRYDATYIDDCLGQLETLLLDVRADPSTCPADTLDRAPACTQAFVEAKGGPCRAP